MCGVAVGSLQYMVRELLVEPGNAHQSLLRHSMIRKFIVYYFLFPYRCQKKKPHVSNASRLGPDEMLTLRWNSQYGAAFVDGSHFKHDLELGDELMMDSHAPFLQIFDATTD